jgi:hypothetical protein
MTFKPNVSLRSLVFQWFRDNPQEAFKRSCRRLYDAFLDEDQMLLRSYKAEYVDEVTETYGYVQKQETPKKRKKKAPDFKKYKDVVKCPHCPGAYANEIKKFVGFRGQIKNKRHPKGGLVAVAVLDFRSPSCPYHGLETWIIWCG